MVNKNIIDLMRVSEQDRDIQWLKDSLQNAITLEFSTIPPYLCAYWSIKNDNDEAATSIHEIVVEEMLHMALACNLLVAIGGDPDINKKIPIYPGPLPGGVHPGLEVSLRGISKEAVKVFMEIEFPENGPIAFAEGETFPTIGAFYSAIQNVFETLNPPLSDKRQLDGRLGLFKITSIEDVKKAISLIKRQGEGSKDSPEDTGEDDLAHYYLFKEIHDGKKLQKNSTTGRWEWVGNKVFPESWPMNPVPVGGYKREQVSDEVWNLLITFDTDYTGMLDNLQNAWMANAGNQDFLRTSIKLMRKLGASAISLMKIPIEGGGGNYGPCFRKL